MRIEDLIPVARGKREADLVLRGAKVVNLFSGEVLNADVAIYKDRIAGLGKYKAKKTLDLKGAYLSPGFIDGHVHLESSMLTVPEFARAVLPLGTTTVVADPHEIANVLGREGIRYLLRSSEGCLLDVYFMLPSCVPATPLETSGARLSAKDLQPFFSHPRVLGLGEMMNYPGVLHSDKGVLAKLRAARGRPIDGHCPGLSGFDLNGYICAGIRSDHECTSAPEAVEKLRAGMTVMIREGTAAKNLKDLIPLVSERNADRFLLVTDDRHPDDILTEGHLNFLVREAVRSGLDPILALRLAALNPARYFGLRDRGAIAPGYQADLVALDGLDSLNVRWVMKAGRVVAEDGRVVARIHPSSQRIKGSMRIDWGQVDFKIKPQGKVANVIGLVPHQITTEHERMEAKVAEGYAVSDPGRDMLKMAVIERHTGRTKMGLGFVTGFGLRAGALASSVAHDAHNLLVVGVTDEEMMAASKEVCSLGGGQVAVRDGKVLASLPLPIAGLISDRPLSEVAGRAARLREAARSELGCKVEDPFMSLSFLALSPIPKLKLTDQGLIDVTAFKPIPLFS